ncbi:MAG: RNase J family beta-CASP ribonuclease [Nanoarchaeota archaeon]|nr:RNase J family beta-CASP ribonuclease [Nanoarchaeota archaeon]
MIELWAVGGYSEVGSKNMTAIRIDDEVIILDMGYNVGKIVEYEGTEGEELVKLPYEKMLAIDAIPNDTKLHEEWGSMVKAIVIGHAHIDHCGAVRLLAPRYKKAPIIGTPFTLEVVRNTLEGKRIPNKFIPLNPSSKYKISDRVTIELVNMTHSTPQTSAVVIHTPYGKIVYANDYKLDDHPLIGKKPNYSRLKEISKNCLALISDTTRVEYTGHTPSEMLAREMLKDVLMRYLNRDVGIIVTTFSSHIARLSTLISLARKMGREPLLVGRSISNYLQAAKRAHIFSTDAKVFGYKRDVNKALRRANKEKSKYFVICTGNQGEPNSVLSRIANDETPYVLGDDDIVIFSCTVIPTPVSEANRKTIENKLLEKNVRIFRDIHVSGHASREDQKEFLQMLKPKHYFPTHGGIEKQAAAAKIAESIGYKINENVHILQDGQRMVIQE